MNNGSMTTDFLSSIAPEAKELILESIAKHYGTTPQDIEKEVTDPNAHQLLEYMTEPERSTTNLMMRQKGFI